MTWKDIVLTFWVCDQYPLMCPFKLIFLNFGFVLTLWRKVFKRQKNWNLMRTTDLINYSKWSLFFVTAFSFILSAVTEMYEHIHKKLNVYEALAHRMIRKQQCMQRFLNFVMNNKANLARSSPCEIHLAYRSFFKKKFLTSLPHFLTL